MRAWKNITVGKLKPYIGSSAWNEIHEGYAVPDYWGVDPNVGPIHVDVRKAMPSKR